jgi:diacylglycerol O-acyltransferase / wax synthase
VNIRTDDSDEGNAISFLLANLGTHLADPLERLAARPRLDGGRQAAARRDDPRERLQYGIALSAAAHRRPADRVSRTGPPEFNVVISNVPGPKEPLHWNGARLDGLYPRRCSPTGTRSTSRRRATPARWSSASPPTASGCRSVQRMIDHLEDGLAALEKALGI